MQFILVRLHGHLCFSFPSILHGRAKRSSNSACFEVSHTKARSAASSITVGFLDEVDASKIALLKPACSRLVQGLQDREKGVIFSHGGVRTDSGKRLKAVSRLCEKNTPICTIVLRYWNQIIKIRKGRGGSVHND